MSLPRLFKPFQHMQSADVHQVVSNWFETPLGQEVLTQEKQLLAHLMPSMFGFYLVQAGVGVPQPLADNTTIQHKVYVSEQPQQSSGYRCFCSALDELALATDSVDVAILHHSLDFHHSPHRSLKEITRAVIPGGKIVIIGFNPWSLWGIARFFLSQSNKVPWSGNFISPYRLSDWLKLLDFQVEGCESAVYSMPSSHTQTRKLFEWLAFLGKRIWRQKGGIYVLVATKQVATVTPIKPRFQSVRDTLANIPMSGIVKPSTRNTE